MFQKIKSHGVVHSLEIVIHRLLPAWIFRFFMGVVYELDVAKLSELAETAASKRYVLECVENPLAIAKLRQLTWNTVPPDTTQNHFGYSICRADDPQSVIGGVWGGIQRFSEADLGFEVELAPDQAWIYCAFVTHGARGEGAYTQLLAFAVNDLQRRGYTRPRVVILAWNQASTHVHRKYAAATVGKIISLRICGLATVFCSGGIKKNKTWTTSLRARPVLLEVP